MYDHDILNGTSFNQEVKFIMAQLNYCGFFIVHF